VTVRCGDEFDAFFRKHLVPLVQHIMRRGFNEECAKEAAAETMATLYWRWGEIEQPYAWACQTGYYNALNEVNSRKTHLIADPESLPTKALSHHDEDAIVQQESKAKVIKLLEGLSDRRRAVISYWLDGFEDHDTAKQLGISEPTVRSHRRYALRDIAKRLGLEESQP
jgi:RNA polymerase sigma factor (sigma-70 family)